MEGQLANLSTFCQQNGKPAAEAVPLADTNATLLAAQAGRADAAGMTQAAAIDVTTQQKDAFTYVTQTEQQGATTDNLAMLVPKTVGWARSCWTPSRSCSPAASTRRSWTSGG